MPENPGEWKRLERMSLQERISTQPDTDYQCQKHWYYVAGHFARKLTVLDLGAGVGYGAGILGAMNARGVLSIDPLPAGRGVFDLDPSIFPDDSFDMVTCIDVLEHVDKPEDLLAQAVRIARLKVFISTPTYRGKFGSCHAREYSASEIERLLSKLSTRWWAICRDPLDSCWPMEVKEVTCPSDEHIGWGVLITKRRETR